MTKLKRINAKIFGENATATGEDPQIGQFGSAKANTFVGTTDVEIIQSLPAWKNGWSDAVTPTQNFPALPEMTGAMKVLSHEISYLYQMGKPEWDEDTIYYKNSFCQVEGKEYKSLIDENQGNNPTTSPTSWEESSSGGGGLEIGDIGIAPLGIDESLGKRRYLNGSVIIQDQYQVFTEKVKTAIQTYAGLGCTEEEWQTISNMSVGGQCGKFVVDDEAGTIRLPKIIMPIQGLTDLTKLGEIVEAGLPNITGKVGYLGVHNSTLAEGAFTTAKDGESLLPASGTAPYSATFDASRCSDVYGNSATVQQEQIQYPYFIQVATGSEYQENITNEIELNNPFVLLEGQYFNAPVYNSSWLQSNASFTGSLALHPTAYNALLIEQNPNVEVGTTIDNYTKRGLSVKLDTEAYTDYDFVLNTTSQTFRCPLKINKASGRAVVGNGIGLGLTDGEDFSSIVEYQENIKSRLNYGQAVGTVNTSTASFVNNATLGITTDPTKSGIETSDDNVYLYFYVGETVQNANLVNVGRVEEIVANCITLNDCPSYVTETYFNNENWYKVYSNGWCEQVLSVPLPSQLYGETIANLLLEMKDTTYTIIITGINLTNAGNYTFSGAQTKTTTTVGIWQERTTGANHNNHAFVYIAGYKK